MSKGPKVEKTENSQPSWANKLRRDTRIDPNVRVMYRVAAVIALLTLIWAVAESVL